MQFGPILEHQSTI